MKKICFLVGGLGNHFFQIVNSGSKLIDVRANYFFCSRLSRTILSHTKHPQATSAIFKLADSFYTYIYLPLVMLDLVFAFAFGKTLITQVDLRTVSGVPVIANKCRIGYFQSPGTYALENISSLKSHIIDIFDSLDGIDSTLVIHYRQGDFIKSGISKPDAYYMEKLKIMMDRKGVSLKSILVLSNSPDKANIFVEKVKLIIDPNINISYQVGDVIDDFGVLCKAKYLIGSNSTFSLAASLLNSDLEIVSFDGTYANMFSQYRSGIEMV